MVEILVVDPVEELLGDDYDTFLDAKAECLTYLEASVQRPIGPDRVYVDRAHSGAVQSPQDAERFLAALSRRMPHRTFVIRTKQYAEATRIVWHEVR